MTKWLLFGICELEITFSISKATNLTSTQSNIILAVMLLGNTCLIASIKNKLSSTKNISFLQHGIWWCIVSPLWFTRRPRSLSVYQGIHFIWRQCHRFFSLGSDFIRRIQWLRCQYVGYAEKSSHCYALWPRKSSLQSQSISGWNCICYRILGLFPQNLGLKRILVVYFAIKKTPFFPSLSLFGLDF